MEHSEQPKSRIENPELIAKIRAQFADEWEELVTGGGIYNDEEFEYVEKIRRGERVPKRHIWVREKLIRIGQDHRLTPDEIAALENIFLE